MRARELVILATPLKISAAPGKKLAVISHERSGTHFLMNTIAANFNYISKPWWNFDNGEPVNFHSPSNIEQYLRRAHGKHVQNIFKSHHTVGFFEEIMDYFADQFQIFYIYRDPRDALISNWKLARTLPWDEGPKTESAALFVRAEPSGAMMRYQKRQEKNMLTRWRTHVEGWINLAERNPGYGISVLSYENLNLDFDSAVRRIGSTLGQKVDTIRRPSITENVISNGQGKVGDYVKYFDDSDLAFISGEIGATLNRLNYDI
jgi:hypothetical protein